MGFLDEINSDSKKCQSLQMHCELRNTAPKNGVLMLPSGCKYADRMKRCATSSDLLVLIMHSWHDGRQSKYKLQSSLQLLKQRFPPHTEAFSTRGQHTNLEAANKMQTTCDFENGSARYRYCIPEQKRGHNSATGTLCSTSIEFRPILDVPVC